MFQVAQGAGLTPSAISQIEHGRVSPSILNLRRIAAALGLSVFELLADADDRPHRLVRRIERRTLSLPRSSVNYELISPSLRGRFEVVSCKLAPGARTSGRPMGHGGQEECLIILSGRGQFQLGDELLDLRDGDAITFDCSTPHRLTNAGSGVLEAIFVVSPPAF